VKSKEGRIGMLKLNAGPGVRNVGRAPLCWTFDQKHWNCNKIQLHQMPLCWVGHERRKTYYI